MLYYTIYETTNMVNSKTYIGKHQTKNPNDNYIGSGKYLRKAVDKYGLECFKKEVLFVFDNKEDMNAKEIELVTEEYVKRDDNYNLGVGGQGGGMFSGRTHSDATKAKLSIIGKKPKNYTEEAKERHRQAGRRPCSEETKRKISEGMRKRKEINAG